jgi:hypothetical protein
MDIQRLQPIDSLKLRFMKKDEDEKRRHNLILKFVEQLYYRTIDYARKSEQTKYKATFTSYTSGSHGIDLKFILDNMNDIISELKLVFHDSMVNYEMKVLNAYPFVDHLIIIDWS